jgi:hypothetical protein
MSGKPIMLPMRHVINLGAGSRYGRADGILVGSESYDGVLGLMVV